MNQKIIKCSDFEIGNNRKIVLISGPCQMESEDHAVEMAYKIKEITGKLNINLIYCTIHSLDLYPPSQNICN